MKTLILALAVSALSFAQPGGREKINPEQRMEKQLKEMTASLNLTEKQQSEVRTVLKEQMKKREAKREEMKSIRQRGEKPTDEQRAEAKKRLIDEQLEMKNKLKKILTEEQLKKLQELRREKGGEMMEKRKAAKKAE